MQRISCCALILAVLLIGATECRSQSLGNLRRQAQNKTLSEIISDLRSDDVRWNAVLALNDLIWHRGPEKVPLLEEALDSDDWQQRQLAAEALRLVRDHHPSERLCEVTVEGLKDDDLPGLYDPKGCVFAFNAASGVRYLLAHARSGTPYLEAALDSDDPQQRYLSAYVLGATGRYEQVEKIVKILIPHLKNDNVFENACMAAYALCHLGKPALAYLRPHVNAPDEQQRSAVKLIVKDIESPPETRADLVSRKRLHNLSSSIYDPAVQQHRFAFFGLAD